MVADLFGALLEEFGNLIDVKLQPDALHSCVIKTQEGVKVQLELDRSSEHMVIACKLPEIPASGGYRESVFREALKANGMPPPLRGIFAYSKTSKSLILYGKLDINGLTGAKILAFFNPFVAKAQVWHDALTRGDVPVGTAAAAAKPSGGLFGLK